jgi:putative ABC transport system permease protein
LNSHTLHINLYNIVSQGTFFPGLTLAVLLGFAKRINHGANLFLGAALAAIVLKTGGVTPYLLLALGPLLYFYVRQLTFPERRFCWKDALHFSSLLVVFLIPAWLILISVIVYLYLSHRLIEECYSRLQPVLTDRPRFAFRWLQKALLLLAFLCVLSIFIDFFYFSIAFVLIVMAAEAVMKPDSRVELTMPLMDRSDAREKGRRLKKAVAVNRLYEDAELTLTTLAVKLNIHPHDLSRIINTGLEKNFSDFINEFRVREISRKMQDPVYDRLTLLGIAYESGFNSQRTFNRVFKEMTGKTPLEYKNSLKKELPNDKLANLSKIRPVILRPGSPPMWSPSKLNRNIMIKNYFKIAFRGFWKHKLFTLINIIGLSIGISAFLVIYIILHYDFTFDKFHKDSDRIYRVVMNISFQGHKNYSSGVPGPLPEAIKSQATGIEEITPLYSLSPHFVYIDKDKNAQKRFKDQDRIVLANQQYFKIFNYVWLAGSTQHALDAPGKVVLTAQQARLYFPSLSYHEMIGKVVIYDTLKTTVSGVVETLGNTDFTFHDFISINTATTNKRFSTDLRINTWDHIFSGSEVFLKLTPGATVPGVVKQINTIFRKSNPPRAGGKGPAETADLALQPLDDIHFNPDYNIFDFSSPASKTTLYGLLAIGIFLLLLACINYVNLTTAQAAQRAKEIGIRKTLGSSRTQLIVQFLGETFFITLFAVCISVLLAPTILKMFANVISPDIHANMLQPDVMLFLLILTIVISILSGFYPAIVLSGYKLGVSEICYTLFRGKLTTLFAGKEMQPML